MTTPIGPYSPIVEADGWLVCSGQLGLVDGALVEGVAAQTAQSLKNAAALLTGHGASLADVVKTTVFLADMADFAEVNRVYAEAFGDHRPARSTVAVAGLPMAGLVEIEVWARKSAG
ncbi:MAG: Rid family detoxifying hydrolase [Acidimicrobiales bacterium]